MKKVRFYIQKSSFIAFAFIVMLTASFGAFMAVSPSKAQALSGSEFNAGRIIDDVVFTNHQAMSVADIQNFLNAKVPNCDTSGSQNSSHWNSGANRYYTRAEWGASKGYPAPYTCLKSYYENTSTFANNAADPNSGVPGGLSAAQIIYNAAQAYQINPQVILTTLQKEQGLITDDWPWENQYNYAMGYGCPDTAGCSSSYRGFFKQVDNAAWQFRRYLENPHSYNYWVGNYYVQYNPNSSCGGSVVNIQNRATAALYIYTPYQPNSAALNNLGGSGDSCSAYGNRNFWYYFTNWFGSTQAASYSYQVLDQYVYSDQNKTNGTNLYNKMPGDRVYVGIKVRNTGNRTWSNTGGNPVNVGTEWPSDRNSAWCDTSWLGCNRPARLIESSVAPGETGTFEFWMKAGNNAGSYKEYFNLVVEGIAWMPATGLNFGGSVQQVKYTWQPVDQYVYSDSSKTHGTNTMNKMPGDRVYVGIKARNTGNVTWSNSGPNPIRVGTSNNNDRSSVFYDSSSWIDRSRTATMVESSVAPGQIGTFEFWMKAGNNPGGYLEYFNLIAEGKTWMNNPGLNFRSSIQQPNYSWQLTDQYAYTDSSKTVGKGTTNLNPGDTVYVGFKAKNTGNVVWRNTGSYPVNVGMTQPTDRLSLFMGTGWLGQNRPARLIESEVAPGQTGTFEFVMKAPNRTGIYREYFSLVAEGIAWMNDPGMNFYMSVK